MQGSRQSVGCVYFFCSSCISKCLKLQISSLLASYQLRPCKWLPALPGDIKLLQSYFEVFSSQLQSSSLRMCNLFIVVSKLSPPFFFYSSTTLFFFSLQLFLLAFQFSSSAIILPSSFISLSSPLSLHPFVLHPSLIPSSLIFHPSLDHPFILPSSLHPSSFILPSIIPSSFSHPFIPSIHSSSPHPSSFPHFIILSSPFMLPEMNYVKIFRWGWNTQLWGFLHMSFVKEQFRLRSISLWRSECARTDFLSTPFTLLHAGKQHFPFDAKCSKEYI